MARHASRILGALAALLLTVCVEAPPPEARGPTTAERLGVPKGADIYQSRSEAAEFDTHVDRYADMTCRTLDATIAALAGTDGAGPGTTRRIANAGGALIPGPAGTLTRVVAKGVDSGAAPRGNIRLSAAQAVRVAKQC